MAKLDEVRLEGEPHNPSSLAFAAHVVNTLHEFTKSQLSFPAMGFHSLNYNPGESGTAMGSSPHLNYRANAGKTSQGFACVCLFSWRTVCLNDARVAQIAHVARC